MFRTLVETTAAEIGEDFMKSLVRQLCESLGTAGAWVTEYLPEERRLRSMAFYMASRYQDTYEYALEDTPCEPVIDENRLVHFPDRIVELFPNDPDLPPLGAVSYAGVPLRGADGAVLGHLALLDTKPMPADPRLLGFFRIFGERAAAELRRLRADQRIRVREAQLSGVIRGAMDAILELDPTFVVTMANPAAERVFGCASGSMRNRNFGTFLDADGRSRLAAVLEELTSEGASEGASDGVRKGAMHRWVPGGLTALRRGETPFTAEITISRIVAGEESRYILVLRDVEERLAAERRLNELTAETEYLRDRVRSLGCFDEIAGESPALLEVLDQVSRVAGTDASVLIRGETGTGKELIARAIHQASARSDRPLITVNCAAIPRPLIESEFFGHTKGAFTGATSSREGRFALADGGTIFLDEVGELPLDIQAKLLRVLQNGEFSPVGSSRARRVDVRMIAATNRDLDTASRDGSFRRDLFFRLNVFPLFIPPLRERGNDVVTLADTFAARLSERSGRPVMPFSERDRRRLLGYEWPGNVRELQNVVERAFILATDGRLDFDGVLPAYDGYDAKGAQADRPPDPGADDPRTDRVLTQAELREFERKNLSKALARCSGRVSGPGGAAELLGMNPSTLYSRLKALEIRRDRDGRSSARPSVTPPRRDS